MEANMKDQIEGKAKELKGKVTNDQSTELEGKTQQQVGRAKGKVQGKAEELKGKVRQATS
jgi:uncharacterized protein YjbJ (UPF0337 family)